MKTLRYTICLLFICLSLSLAEGASYRLIGEHYLDIGNRWEYQVTITEYPGYGTVNWVGTSSEEVILQENIAGYNTVRVDGNMNISPLGSSWVRHNGYLTSNHLVDVRYEDEDIIEIVKNNDPFEFLPVWVNNTDNNRLIGHGQYDGQLKSPYFTYDGYQDAWITFLRTETITVAAGMFDCVVVFIREEFHDSDGMWGYVEETVWIDPEVGEIKSDEHSWIWEPIEGVGYTIRGGEELTSFTYGDPPPEISSVTATPSTILDKQTSQLQVVATDPISGPSPLSYNWIVPPGQGSLDDNTSSTPIYTPPDTTESEVTVTLTVEVTDGHRTSSSTVDINVLDVDSVNFDFFVDYFIDSLDFTILASYWVDGNCSEPNWCMGTDIDHSGMTEFFDFGFFIERWLTEMVNPNLVAYWPLDDNDSNTFVSDISINGHNGTASVNTSLLSAPGQINTCFDFAGTDAVAVTDDDAFSFGNGAVDRPFSFSAWIYVTPSSGYGIILSKVDGASNLREWLFDFLGGNYLRLWLSDQSGPYSISRTSDAALSTGWHFVAATYEGQSDAGNTAANLITLYVDGAEVTSTATNNANYDTMENKTVNVAIGARYEGGSLAYYWPDKIDDVQIFSKCLTASEITALYGEGL